MLAFLDALGSIAVAWGRSMQRPLHEHAPPPSPDLLLAQMRRAVAMGEAAATMRVARDAEPALLPSTDYRTNPRPAQVPIVPRCYY